MKFLKAAATAALVAASMGFGTLVAGAQQITMRVGNVYPATHTIPIATQRMKELIEQRSNGRIQVQVFNNSELGSEREMAEMTRQGSLEMVLSGLPGTGAYAPEIEVMEAFYIYRNVEDLQRISAAIFDDLQEFVQPKGFHLVGMMYQGPRNTLSTRQLKTLADFRGLRLRIPTRRSSSASPALGRNADGHRAGRGLHLARVRRHRSARGHARDDGDQQLPREGQIPADHAAQPLSAAHRREQELVRQAAAGSARHHHDRGQGRRRLPAHPAQGRGREGLATMRAAGVTITELSDAEIQQFRAPLVEMNRQHFANRGPKVVAVYEKMLKLSNY